MIKTLEDFELSDLLPDSLKGDPDVLAMAAGLTSVYKEVYAQIQAVKFHEGIPDHLLDFIAYEEGVEYYDANLTIQEKRTLIEKAPLFHKLKGTVAAVEQMVAIFFKKADVVEWFDYGGDPYHFQIEIEQHDIEAEELKKVRVMVEATKNIRSRLEAIILRMPMDTIQLSNKTAERNVPLPITNCFTTDSIKGRVFETTKIIDHRTHERILPFLVCGVFYAHEAV